MRFASIPVLFRPVADLSAKCSRSAHCASTKDSHFLHGFAPIFGKAKMSTMGASSYEYGRTLVLTEL